jgi:hypothetical protein
VLKAAMLDLTATGRATAIVCELFGTGVIILMVSKGHVVNQANTCNRLLWLLQWSWHHQSLYP